MNKIGEFENLRPLLFSIAYRILGSVGEAEDAVQETWLRFDRSTTEPISAKAFLSTTVSRIALDVLSSARKQRERYVGPWFPEPLLTDPYSDPARAAELADSVSMAALLLLERLSPLERATFVLRDVFGFEFAEIAVTIERSEDACRQLLVRARRHMADGRPRFAAARQEREDLAGRFFAALREGNLAGLQELLAADATMVGDSGGKAPSLARTVAGADNVARLLMAAITDMTRVDVAIERSDINGQPGAIFRDADGNVLNALAIDVWGGRISTLRLVINPEKLGHLGPVADAWAVDRAARTARRTARIAQSPRR